ncbi:hypothetical protein [Saccharothrix variisporea]|uniref:Uncharacterized protein n=1 Tax=Saccharothrix variisporea TaxID=543527 RepID=A0A495XDR9_9PSEU|nr:hypothetical protein [Saccharothrix variisporea]RKT71809.1 hypothetical protein DFJ66_5104 [Saccharothrix variisporea]
MTDIKQTLETAFDGEPPLTLDLPGIMKTGKRRVTVRRVAAGVAVLATATVVCVPAMLGSSGGGGSVQVASQPTVSLTTTASPSTTSMATETTKPGTTGGPQTMPVPQPPRPVTDERAAQLTALLAGSLPAGARVAPIPGDPMTPWTFAASGNQYKSVTEVTTEAGRGMVLVYLVPGDEPKCEPGCETVRLPDGRTAFVSRSSFEERTLLLVDVAIPGGRVHVQVHNSSDKATSNGNAPLTAEEAVKVAAIPGLTF